MASTYQARELDVAGEATSAMMPGLVDIVSTWQLVGVDRLVAVSVGTDVGSLSVLLAALNPICTLPVICIGRW